MRKTFAFAASALLLSGCMTASTMIATYTPVIDHGPNGPTADYQADLAYCQSLASNKHAKAQAQEHNRAFAGLVVGAIAGAALGSALGDSGDYQGDWTRWGAASGAVAGASNYNADRVNNEPKRIVDRCMIGRGHRVLNSVGGA